MNTPSLPEIIEINSRLDHVLIVPKTKTPINIFDFMERMEALVKTLGLKGEYAGCGHSSDWESARKAGENPFEDNKYHCYWVKFRGELPANRFMLSVNTDPTSPYSVQVPEGKLGLCAFSLIEKIS